MGEPFFSIIVPAHNAVGYMRKGLDSIRRQSFRDYELIVIADKCEDGTARIAEEYADRVIITEHGLCGLARNAGMDVATGKYLLFMDDDDYWMAGNAFEQIHEAAVKSDPDVIFFGFYWNGRGFVTQEKNYCWAVWNKAWRRDFVGDVRFDNYEYGEDVAYTKTLFGKDHRRAYINNALYFYDYMRFGSQSWKYERGMVKYAPKGGGKE